MSEALLGARRVGKVYRHAPVLGRRGRARPTAPVAALVDLTLDFAAGDFTAISGPSGSGKSTLLNILGTLDQPTEGEVLCQGRSVTGLSERASAQFRRRCLGFVFQSYNLIPVLTALENVEYPLLLQGVPEPERRARSMEVLAAVGVAEEADRRPDELSGGQQQRVAVARAIVHRPLLVLADEPTANLDSKNAVALLELMRRLNVESGVTFVFSSHDPAVLARASRVIELRDGRLAA